MSADPRRDRFLVIGDVIDDIVVRPETEIRPDTDTDAVIELRPGGSGANVAAWLGALGCSVEFVGTLSAQDVARHAAALAEHGVHASLAASPEPTGTIVVITSGSTRSMLTSRGANRATAPSLITEEALRAADHLHISGYSILSGESEASGKDWAALVVRAHAAGATVSVDPSSAGYLRDFGPARFLEAIAGADILMPNLDESRALTGAEDPEAIASLLGSCFPVVALTLGARGAIVADDGVTTFVPTRGLSSVVDVTGAGDAFSAGFLAARAAGARSTEAAGAGHRAAAVALHRSGGRPPGPSSH